MRDWTRGQLQEEALRWLGDLPLSARITHGGCRFVVIHATPRDPLFDYRLRPAIDERLFFELTEGIDADVLVLGHTHLPLLRHRETLQVVNPGSVGQPLDRDPRAAYAIWEDGAITLARADYDRGPALAAVEGLTFLPIQQRNALTAILRRGWAT
jgi:protein phosphatase